MDYNVIQYKSNEEIDNLFKRIILKMVQLYEFHKNEITLIAKQLQDYRNLLKTKDYATLNIDNIKQSLKKFDDTLAKYYNDETIARKIYLKQLKLMHKLLKEDFNLSEYEKLPFQKLYLTNKEKYELLNDELKDMFFNYYTSNKKVKPIMEILKLWFSIKEKKLRNIIRSEINQFKSELNASAFKEVKKDTKDYITKTNEALAKTIRGEVKEIVEGGPLDKLRFLTSQSFETKGKEPHISNELLSQLNKFKLLKDKYKPLINKYEQARETDKFNIRRDIESALYELKPVYEYCKEAMKKIDNNLFEDNKKYELQQLIDRINTLDNDKLNYLYQEFSKYAYLFNNDKQKNQDIINNRYEEIFKNDIDTYIINSMINTYNNFNPSTKRPILRKEWINNKSLPLDKKYGGHFKTAIHDAIVSALYHFNLEYDTPKFDELIKKYDNNEMIDKIIYPLIVEEENKRKEEEEKRKAEEEEIKRKAEEEALRKAEEEKRKQQEEEDEDNEEDENNEDNENFEEAEEINGIKGFGCTIPDIKHKTLTQILEEINNKYNQEDNKKLDKIIYYNIKSRFPNKSDDKINELFIKNLKKYDKKYKNDKYKEYMKNKKYSKSYIEDELLTSGGVISKLLGFIGLSPSVFEEKNIKGHGIISNLLSMVGLSDSVFDNDDILIKIKPLINLLKKVKNDKELDAYIYSLVKLEDDDDDEEEIKEKFNKLLYEYDKNYRPKLFNKRIKKDFYNIKSGFPLLALAPLIPSALSGLSQLINSIRGKGCNDDKKEEKKEKKIKAGAILSLKELQELEKEIK